MCDKIEQISLSAKQEQENNLQHLIYQYIITLFSYLDNGIKNFVISIFKYMPESLDVKEVKNIEISISEYRKKSNDEIAHYIFTEYEKNMTKGEMYGISRFEKLLRPLGFGGEVSKEVIKDIFELARFRNIIVYNGGIADMAIIKLCTQLNLEFEKKVIITKEDLNRYTVSTIKYLTLLSQRVGEYVKNNVDRIFGLEE